MLTPNSSAAGMSTTSPPPPPAAAHPRAPPGPSTMARCWPGAAGREAREPRSAPEQDRARAETGRGRFRAVGRMGCRAGAPCVYSSSLESSQLTVNVRHPRRCPRRIASALSNSGGSSASDEMLGTPGGGSPGSAPSRRSRTAEIPAASAPRMSWSSESPTCTARSGAHPASANAAVKIAGAGFGVPTSRRGHHPVNHPLHPHGAQHRRQRYIPVAHDHQRQAAARAVARVRRARRGMLKRSEPKHRRGQLLVARVPAPPAGEVARAAPPRSGGAGPRAYLRRVPRGGGSGSRRSPRGRLFRRRRARAPRRECLAAARPAWATVTPAPPACPTRPAAPPECLRHPMPGRKLAHEQSHQQCHRRQYGQARPRPFRQPRPQPHRQREQHHLEPRQRHQRLGRHRVGERQRERRQHVRAVRQRQAAQHADRPSALLRVGTRTASRCAPRPRTGSPPATLK